MLDDEKNIIDKGVDCIQSITSSTCYCFARDVLGLEWLRLSVLDVPNLKIATIVGKVHDIRLGQ